MTTTTPGELLAIFETAYEASMAHHQGTEPKLARKIALDFVLASIPTKPAEWREEKSAAEMARDAWQNLVEQTDRTSPEEYPEMALITFEELHNFIRLAAKPADDRLEAWMAWNEVFGIQPKAFWSTEPTDIIKKLHKKGGWQIRRVEVRLSKAMSDGGFLNDGDNTPQGKLARGCFYIFYWIIGFGLLLGLVDGFMILIGARP